MPLMSKIASGLPSLATTFAASSLIRILPSWSRSAKLKSILNSMPPSTPALTSPSEIPAPTAICQDGRVAAGDELLQAEGVVPEADVDPAADPAAEEPDERPDDRDFLPVVEVEAQFGQLDLEQGRRLAEHELEDLGGLEDREGDPARIGDAGLEPLGLRALGALCVYRGQGVGQLQVVEVLHVAQVTTAAKAQVDHGKVVV
jgi:hypothetical protein